MLILFLTTAHNSMSQRMYAELTGRGHRIAIQIVNSEQDMIDAAERHEPELILAPFLKIMIPKSVWSRHTTLVVHPGIKGDRGPFSLDWAIMDGNEEWGVTLLQADEEMDAGDIWATAHFRMKNVSKSRLYRHEVTQAAVKCVLEAIESIGKNDFRPEPLDYSKDDVKGKLHPKITQADRRIDWAQTTEAIAKKIRAADSHPGVLDEMFGQPVYLFGAHEEDLLKGVPGEILGYRDGAVCRATGDGAIWITHVKPKGCFKLPAALAFKDRLDLIPHLPLSPFAKYEGRTYREIFYEEKNRVGYLHFDFYNGAMSTEQCIRLKEAYLEASKRDIKVIVLMGGIDFWSNGIHLNVIEHAESPADESWANINAMNDLVREIVLTGSRITISAMQGNAGAGGVILALAADRVYAREGIVLNPHYKKMGGLYGSEYWTYLLPGRVGPNKALELTEQCLPIGTASAESIGLVDGVFGEDQEAFCSRVEQIAQELAESPNYAQFLQAKREKRFKDEQSKPLEHYRSEELRKMRINFYGENPAYHEARRQFVYKLSCSVEAAGDVRSETAVT
ncbi:hydrogenase maturation protein [Paenibacillus hamazuiensis]|uniref:hydrogenase maturation protein n=1 Tax=Paenibacillus hamazuiensis TaxID=2936508 RepID=UPI00200DC1FE|nr:hydrogenase maturation protein [Paenibacillus hamazuiensis]